MFLSNKKFYIQKGILLTYDITNQKSFDSVSIWLQNIHKNAPEDIQLVLIANKCDLVSERVVSYEKGEEVSMKVSFIKD